MPPVIFRVLLAAPLKVIAPEPITLTMMLEPLFRVVYVEVPAIEIVSVEL